MSELLTRMKKKPSSSILFQSIFNSKVENQFIFEEQDLICFAIAEKEIESILNKLDTIKINGTGDRSSLLLKNFVNTINRSLLLLFQLFL